MAVRMLFRAFAQPGAELAVPFAILETLTVRFQRRCMRSHVIDYLQNP